MADERRGVRNAAEYCGYGRRRHRRMPKAEALASCYERRAQRIRMSFVTSSTSVLLPVFWDTMNSIYAL